MEERLRDLETERQQEIQRQILKEEAEQRAKEEELRIKEKELIKVIPLVLYRIYICNPIYRKIGKNWQ